MKTYRYTLERRQQCWTCGAEFMAAHSSQFTDIAVEAPIQSSRFVVVALLKGMFAAWRTRRRVNAIHRPARIEKGWS